MSSGTNYWIEENAFDTHYFGRGVVYGVRRTDLVVVSGEHILCLNEKPTLREDLNWDILGES